MSTLVMNINLCNRVNYILLAEVAHQHGTEYSLLIVFVRSKRSSHPLLQWRTAKWVLWTYKSHLEFNLRLHE